MKLSKFVPLLVVVLSSPLTQAQEIALRYAVDTNGEVRSAAFTNDGNLIAIVSGITRDIRFWNTTSGKPVLKLSGGDDPKNQTDGSISNLGTSKPGAVALRFSPDSRVLAILAEITRDIRLWDIPSGKLFRVLSGAKGMWSFEFSPDGKLLAVAMGSQGLKLLDVYNGKLIPSQWDFKDVSLVTGATFNSEGTNLLVAIGSSNERNSGFYLVDIASGNIKSTILAPGLVGQVNYDGSRLLTFEDNNNDLKLWDLNTGELKNVIKIDGSKILDAAISNDGLSVAGITKDGRLRVWNTQTSALMAEFQKQRDKSARLIFSNNSNTFFLIDEVGVRVCFIPSGVIGPPLQGARVIYDISPNGELFLTDKKGGGAQLWQISK